MINVGILGSAGYTGGELLRLLLRHPYVNIKSAVSSTQVHQPISIIHKDLVGDTDLRFVDRLDEDLDLAFLCLGHGHSQAALEHIPKKSCIIDLSHDFRLTQHAQISDRNFIYGLPELRTEAIQRAKNIANPGCFATAIQLAILPLAKEGLLKENIHISSITGSTGSGRVLSESGHFTWRDHNVSTYKIFLHQHVDEIRENVLTLQGNFSKEIFFIPYRGNFTRGIFSTIYTYCDLTLKEANFLYKDFYNIHPFTHVSDYPIDLKQIINTNKCLLFLTKEKEHLIISSVLDNLLKGASGQAVQNMNIMYNYNQMTGLYLKPLAF